MILAAHQPLFLPWLGFFDKARRADIFVVVDHVQFERQDFQNRNRILAGNETRWVIVPVLRGSRDDRIHQKEIDHKPDGRTTWGQRVAATLHHAYARAPYARLHLPFLEDALTRPFRRLVELNACLLTYFFTQLEIKTPVLWSSMLPGIKGQRSEMILSLCTSLGARTYLSGEGGSREYLDVDLFERAGIDVRWQGFDHPVYSQLGTGPFVPKLSVIDLLMNCGPASAAILRGQEQLAESETRAWRRIG